MADKLSMRSSTIVVLHGMQDRQCVFEHVQACAFTASLQLRNWLQSAQCDCTALLLCAGHQGSCSAARALSA